MDIVEFARKYHHIDLKPHQIRWIKFLEKGGKRCILLAPRGHGKTTIVNLVYLSWIIANDPTLHILLVSHSKEMAESFSRSVRNVFENEELLEEFNIETATPWRAGSWTLKSSKDAKPTVRVVGAMGRMTGWRGDIVIFDDLLEITQISSEAIRNKIQNWIDTEVLPAINPGDKERVIVVGTRKHIDDWYGQLLINPDYKKLVDRAIKKNNHLLWPDRFTKEVLDTRKREIGPLKFAQEYMNEPAPPEGLEFKYDWLRFYENLPTHGYIKYYMGIDPSHGSTAHRASYFAITIIAHDTINDKIYVVDMYRDKLSQRDQVRMSIKYANEYAPEAMYIESVFAYTHVYDAMKARFVNVHDVDYIHKKIKGTTAVNKQERIKNICAPAIEVGRVMFRHPTLNPYIKTFIEHEYVPFPLGDMDMFDSLTLAIQHLVGERKLTDVPFFFPK